MLNAELIEERANIDDQSAARDLEVRINFPACDHGSRRIDAHYSLEVRNRYGLRGRFQMLAGIVDEAGDAARGRDAPKRISESRFVGHVASVPLPRRRRARP